MKCISTIITVMGHLRNTEKLSSYKKAPGDLQKIQKCTPLKPQMIAPRVTGNLCHGFGQWKRHKFPGRPKYTFKS